jgi:acyl carrier protein
MGGNAIDIEAFIRGIERQLDAPIPGGLAAATRFRELADWTSLQALTVVASFEWDYGVNLSAAEFGRVETIGELYDMVIARMGK